MDLCNWCFVLVTSDQIVENIIGNTNGLDTVMNRETDILYLPYVLVRQQTIMHCCYY